MRLCSAGCASCKVGFHKDERGVAGTGPRGEAQIALDLDRGMIVAAFDRLQARDACGARNLRRMPQQAPANALRLPVAMNRNRHFRGLTSRIRGESRYTDERPILSESQDRLSLLIGPQHGGDLIVSHMLDGRKEAKTQIRSEEHTSELQSLMRTSYAVFCLKKK